MQATCLTLIVVIHLYVRLTGMYNTKAKIRAQTFSHTQTHTHRNGYAVFYFDPHNYCLLNFVPFGVTRLHLLCRFIARPPSVIYLFLYSFPFRSSGVFRGYFIPCAPSFSACWWIGLRFFLCHFALLFIYTEPNVNVFQQTFFFSSLQSKQLCVSPHGNKLSVNMFLLFKSYYLHWRAPFHRVFSSCNK